MTKTRLTYALSILLVCAGGLITGLRTQEWAQIFASSVRKAPFFSSGILFPLLQALLYVLMGISLARMILSKISQPRNLGILLFLLQYVLNLTWRTLFFGSRSFGPALGVLLCVLAAIVPMLIFFRRTDPPAAMLQIPYVLWLCFAVGLNLRALTPN